MAFGTVTGTFQGNLGSISASFAFGVSVGSGAVKVGDLVVVLIVEQTALTVTSVTDDLGGTYTAQNAGTLSGANVSGRMFWRRVATAGTIATITATCTASANDVVGLAAIISGPFLASPVDVNLANAPDLTSPFTAPATGTMAQTTEVVVSWCASTGSAAFTGTSPTTIAIQQNSATNIEGVIGTQVPPSTATVTPTYTGTAPTANELGTISFKGDIGAMDAAYSQPWSLPPVRRIQAARLADDGLFASPATPPTTGWFQPLSLPAPPAKRGMLAYEQQAYPAFVKPPRPAHGAGPYVLQTNATDLIVLASDAGYLLLQTEPLLEGSWHQGWSEPVRRKSSQSATQQQPSAFVPVVVQAVGIGWFTPLSEPVRVRTSPANQQTLAFAPNPIVPTGWSVPLSEPARAKQRAIADYAYAPLVVSEVVTVDKWFNPLAPPLRAKLGLSPSSQQAYFATLVVTETVTPDKWFTPLSDPTRKAGLGAGSQQALAAVPFVEAITESRWHQPWSEPVRSKRGQPAYEQQTSPAFVPLTSPTRGAGPYVLQTNAIDLIILQSGTGFLLLQNQPLLEGSWHQSWSEPVRVKPRLGTPNQAAFFAPSTVIAPEVVTVDKWYAPFRDPIRVKVSLGAASQQAFAFAPNPIIPSFGWFGALSEPPKAKSSVSAASQAFSTISTNPIVSFGWVEQLSEPVRKAGLGAASQQTLAFVATTGEVVTPDKWFEPLVDPVRIKPQLATASQQALAFAPNPIVQSFGWLGNLSDPVRGRCGLSVVNQTAFFAPSRVIPTVAVDFGWFNSLSDPTRRKHQPRVNLFPTVCTAAAAAPENSWFAPLTDPVRVKRGLATANQQSLAFVKAAPFPETVTEDRWHQPWSNPLRSKPGLSAANQTAFFASSTVITPEIVTVDKWFKSFAEPVRVPAGLKAAQQPYFYYQPLPIIASFGWFNNLSEPTRLPARPTRYEQQSWSLFVEPTAVSFGWFNSLSDPTRRKVDIGYLQDYAEWIAISVTIDWFGPFSTPVRVRPTPTRTEQPWTPFQPVVTTDIGWFNNLSEPQRRVPRATPSDQYSGFTPIVSFGWYAPLTNPMLPKKRVLDPPSFSFAPNPIIPSYGWFGSLSLPVRKKPKVWEGHYTFAPNPIIPSYGWFGSLSLPVRIKPKVWEGIYEARPPLSIATVYLATMAATEDQDFFLAVLVAFNPPLRAYVDIIQKDPRHRGNVGVIAPTPQSSTIASIVTPQTVPSTGTPVAAVGARVAIITSR